MPLGIEYVEGKLGWIPSMSLNAERDPATGEAILVFICDNPGASCVAVRLHTDGTEGERISLKLPENQRLLRTPLGYPWTNELCWRIAEADFNKENT